MQNSTIEWTDHTFNPWWGCQRVSPGCEHCYAETLAKRYGHAVWGPAKTTERRMMSDNYWRQPLKWNEAAAKADQRARVFCASMADVFEEHPAVLLARMQLFNLIDATPHLDWLLLTKRPENILPMIPMAWYNEPPHNVWYGTSCEDQRRADERIPFLLQVPARVRFLSCEPLLSAVLMRDEWLRGMGMGEHRQGPPTRIHWIIAGGESGHGARPMHPDWATSLRDQCQAAGVAFFFKQWGEYSPSVIHAPQQVERTATGISWPMQRVGKHAAGRLLDGCEWNEMPL